jgi:hypothetical protein
VRGAAGGSAVHHSIALPVGLSKRSEPISFSPGALPNFMDEEGSTGARHSRVQLH